MEYDKYLGYAGIKVKNENEGKQIPYVGVAAKKTEGRIFISAVSRNSAAWVDGLNVNDELISVNGVPVTAVVLDRMPVIANSKVAEVITVKIARDGLERDFKVTLKANPNLKLVAEMDPNASAAAVAVRKGWMGI